MKGLLYGEPIEELKLNIGCGRDYKPGWWNCDISKGVKAEAYLDIRKDALPIPDGAADEIYISGVLEQIGDNDQFIFALNECHRVLKPGGRMIVVVPNARFPIAHQDPMDVRKFTAETFAYFQIGLRQYDLYGSVYGFKGWASIVIEENVRHIFIVRFTK